MSNTVAQTNATLGFVSNSGINEAQLPWSVQKADGEEYQVSPGVPNADSIVVVTSVDSTLGLASGTNQFRLTTIPSKVIPYSGTHRIDLHAEPN